MVDSKVLTATSSAIREILDLWDRYEQVHEESPSDGAPSEGDRRARLVEIERGLVSAARRDKGAIGSLFRGGSLSSDELRIVLLLLRRMLSESGPSLKGKRILNTLFPTTYEVLRGTRLLAPGAPLLAKQVVECAGPGDGTPEVVEGEFRLSPTFFEQLRREFDTSRAKPDATPRPFADNLEYLLELKELAVVHRKRCEALFRGDDADEAGSAARLAGARREVLATAARIRSRLEKTERAEGFSAVRFRMLHRLSDEEMLLVVALVFQEIYSGAPYADVVELVKLVADSERELVVKRGLFSEKGNLVRRGILVLDDPSGEQDFGGEASLAAWAFEAVTGDHDREAIGSDLRLDFHEYIQGIDDSRDFFSKLRYPEDGQP